MLMMLPFAAQAKDYEVEIKLHCVWPDGRLESFAIGDPHRDPLDPLAAWIVAGIERYPASVYVVLKNPSNQTKTIDFNDGWPCRIEKIYTFIKHDEPIQPESDSFNPVD